MGLLCQNYILIQILAKKNVEGIPITFHKNGYIFLLSLHFQMIWYQPPVNWMKNKNAGIIFSKLKRNPVH